MAALQSACCACHRMRIPAAEATRRAPFWCRASKTSSSQKTAEDERSKPKKVVDTRIHWSSPDEGWIRFDSEEEENAESTSSSSDSSNASELIADSGSGTHYEFLRLAQSADVEEIRSAYRRMSKLYHPDSTTLPLDVAQKKFFRLKEAHTTLTNSEERKRYDQSLEITFSRSSNSSMGASKSGAMPIWPYEVDPSTAARRSEAARESGIPKVSRQKYMHPVDRLDGRNMPLSDQAQTALVFDLFAILFSLLVIVYVGVFQHGFDVSAPAP